MSITSCCDYRPRYAISRSSPASSCQERRRVKNPKTHLRNQSFQACLRAKRAAMLVLRPFAGFLHRSFSPGKPKKLTKMPQAWPPITRKTIRIIGELARTMPGKMDAAIPQPIKKIISKAMCCEASVQFRCTNSHLRRESRVTDIKQLFLPTMGEHEV